MAPMPTSTLSPSVQPWTMAPWAIETLSPMTTRARSEVQWIIAPSWMFVLLPIVMECTSPRTTALYHTVQLSPITTSPTTTAVSARKQFSPNLGVNPLTERINAIAPYFFANLAHLRTFRLRTTQICLTRYHGNRRKVCIFASLKCVLMEELLGDIGLYKSVPAPEPGVTRESHTGKQRKLYIESYGCQMNFSDSEIVASILANEGFDTTSDINNADVVFLNTCAIREKAEQTVRNRLDHIQGLKKKKPGMLVGVLGCMAERLKAQLLEEEQLVDLVAGPDSYRDLPRLIGEADEGSRGVNTFLSREETYADISPVRLNSNGVTAFISIMRGCDNMCTFCVVPFTRGRERSRDPESIVSEARRLFENGYREVTLLGQNVDSYKWSSATNAKLQIERAGHRDVVTFAHLLERVAQVHPDLRVRFSTSHPKDITDDVLYTMARYDNICKYIHLPVQSGSSRILDLMNRGYTREWYLQKIRRIREVLGEEC